MGRRKKYPQGNGIGSMVPEGWYTRAMAAKMVGRDSDTLKRWARGNGPKPSGRMQAGALSVRLYSDEDIELMRQFASTQKPGPKPKVAV